MQRRRFTNEFKQQIIREANETHNCALVARNHDLSPSQVAKWVRETDYPIPKGISLTKETKELVKQNNMLKKLLAEKELESAILQDLLNAYRRLKIRRDKIYQEVTEGIRELLDERLLKYDSRIS